MFGVRGQESSTMAVGDVTVRAKEGRLAAVGDCRGRVREQPPNSSDFLWTSTWDRFAVFSSF